MYTVLWPFKANGDKTKVLLNDAILYKRVNLHKLMLCFTLLPTSMCDMGLFAPLFSPQAAGWASSSIFCMCEYVSLQECACIFSLTVAQTGTTL